MSTSVWLHRAPEIRHFDPEPSTATPNRAPVAIAIMASAGALFLAAIQAYGSPLRVLGSLPLWPFWFLGCDALGLGSFALFNQMAPVAASWRVAALSACSALIGSFASMGDSDFSWLGDGVFLGGTGTVLALLLWGVDLLNRGD